jgi:MFS family permease
VTSTTIQTLKNRNYRLFASGQVISNTGTWMQRIAQDWLVLQLTHTSGLALGITSMLQALPMLFFGMWGGVIADRYPKRTVLLTTQAVMGALAVILGVLTAAGTVQTWQVYLLALGLGIATVFDQPARQSFSIEMVGRDHLSAAVAINSITFNGARVIGPGLAGFAIGWVGVGPMFLINAASYLAVLLGLLAMRPSELHAADPVARDKKQLRAGLSYVGTHADLLLPIVVIGIVSGFGQSFQLILALLATQNFHQAASGYGILTAGLAIGSVIGAVNATKRTSPRMTVVLGAAATFGVFEIFSALAPAFWACFAVLIPAGVAGLTLNTSANASVQFGASHEMRGRATALYMLVLLSANSLGSLILSAIAQATGPATSIIVGGGIVTVGTPLAAIALARMYKVPLRHLVHIEATQPTTGPATSNTPVALDATAAPEPKNDVSTPNPRTSGSNRGSFAPQHRQRPRSPHRAISWQAVRDPTRHPVLPLHRHHHATPVDLPTPSPDRINLR